MTPVDPIPTDAVEAAARALCELDGGDPDGRAQEWVDGHFTAEVSDSAWTAYVEQAIAALTAAAPHIAVQAARHERERTATAIARLIRARANATLDDRERLSGNISAGYALVFAGIWHKNALLSDDPVAAELTDLRAWIEALRDEWRAGRCACLTCTETRRHADALDALLREGE